MRLELELLLCGEWLLEREVGWETSCSRLGLDKGCGRVSIRGLLTARRRTVSCSGVRGDAFGESISDSIRVGDRCGFE